MAAGIKLGKMSSFELNPRGNIWFHDETTLGHKLLSKMGWSKGKGLGKNEDGIKENIKILRKDNLTGVGFKNDACISVGCVEYENFLKKLQQHFSNEDYRRTENVESLEQRSRNSKSRLHYQKFIKCKDLFQCSEKDMKCIFLENPQESCEDYFKNTIDEENTSKLSMTEYFKQKMQQNICSAAADVTENMTSEKLVSTLSRKRKIEKGSEIRKKIKLKSEKYSNKLQSPPSTAEKYIIPKGMTSFESKDNKSETRKVTKKKKFPKIKNLKSCIKLKSTGVLDKHTKISFNNHVSYKILDNSIENTTDINMPFNSDYNKESDVELLNRSQFKFSINNKDKEKSLETNEMKGNENIVEKKDQMETADQLEESLNDPECLDLPVRPASSYNCWLESQRTALKMKLYRNMIKKLKNHHVLSTTNLLDIKGYGNWGFKL